MTTPSVPSPVAGTGRPGFTVDLARCVGCGACVLACRIENELPSDVSWRRLVQVNRPRIGGGPTYHLSVSCHHCERPPCAVACPSGALKKRQDGVVELEAQLCIGCRYCEMACPFGAPSFDPGAGVMTKCHFCHHRMAEGLSPACVTACPTGALGFSYGPAGTREEGPGEAVDRALVPALAVPGFGDPAGAGPGLWVREPGGTIRSRWFAELRALLGPGEGKPPDAAGPEELRGHGHMEDSCSPEEPDGSA